MALWSKRQALFIIISNKKKEGKNMSIIICSECGKEISDKAASCPNCGAAVSAGYSSTPAPPVVVGYIKKKKKSKKSGSKLPVILMAIAGIILAVISAVAVRIIDGNTLITGDTKLSELRSELESVSAQLTSSKAELEKVRKQVESQSKKIKPLSDIYDASLAAGTYTVGTDLEPGIYHFTYKLRDPDEDWGDYLYVINAGSDGAEETLGGTKFDYRIGAENDGEEISIKLDAGSKVTVTSEYGMWKPGKHPSANQ